ncbi:Alpha/Beta hydrolase protein [Aspergillus coremiiformis]|uniref:Alpha/Beta hydrolase protein n=1 Tax=Aspergillus coremiiformis TaxID=138285 RepID=A0A5N6Z9M9_9EURO|nr:Alpha/Beta hydrolase protein [Aspergillus coremiiformis]
MPLPLDREFTETTGPFLQHLRNLGRPDVHDIETRRNWASAIATGFMRKPLPHGMEHFVHHAPTSTGDFRVPIHHYRMRPAPGGPESDSGKKDPAVVHLHGGGFISLSAQEMEQLLVMNVSGSGVQMLSIDYRLAPEHPYPTAVEDGWAGLQWVYSHAEELSIDKHRIGIMGESAGGCIAAGLALLARDRGLSPPLAKQILVYPMLDDRTADHHAGELVFWTPDDNITGWTAYLGKDVRTDRVSPYAAPARADSVEGLPSIYMDVGQLDMFVQEDTEYALRFVKAGIPVEFHVYPGLPHGFEGLAPLSSCTQRAYEHRWRAIQEI